MFVSSLSIYLHVSLNDINGDGDGRNQLPNYGRQTAQRGAPAPKAHFLKRCYTLWVKKGTDLYTFARSFGRCWRIFEIFTLLNSTRNLQQT